MNKIIKKPFERKQKGAVFALCIVCVVFFIATGCGEQSKSEINFDLELEVDPENVDGAIPVINEFLSNLPNDLTGEQKLNALEKWLIKQPCVIYAYINYYSAIKTVPPTGELIVLFKDTPQGYFMDVAWTNPMTVIRFHQGYCYEHEDLEEAVEVPSVEYSLNETACRWSDACYDLTMSTNGRKLIVINSDKELKNYITCSGNSSYPAIDFTKHTMLLAFGVRGYGIYINTAYLRLYSSGYVLYIDHTSIIASVETYWQIAIITDKLSKESDVDLKLICE